MSKALNIVELENIFMQPRMICRKLYPLITCFYKQVVAIHSVKSGRRGLYQILSMRESPLLQPRRRTFSAVLPAVWNIIPHPP